MSDEISDIKLDTNRKPSSYWKEMETKKRLYYIIPILAILLLIFAFFALFIGIYIVGFIYLLVKIPKEIKGKQRVKMALLSVFYTIFYDSKGRYKR